MGNKSKSKFSFIIILFFLINNFLNAQINESNFNNLLSNQSISVTIGGSFIINGTFQASPTERVDNFITRIFNQAKAPLLNPIKDMESFTNITEEIENVATRNIKLIRSSGETEIIDLQDFRLTGNFQNNPYLKNDDLLIFPPLDLDNQFIEISGAVNAKEPLKFQFVEGDKLSDALLFAQGINSAYENVNKAQISRLTYDGEDVEDIIVDIEDDILLKSGDRIRILGDTPKRKAYKVRIRGEVKREGEIYITKNNTTLYETIKQAGGFTENADLNRAELIRGVNFLNLPSSNREIEIMLMQRMSNIDPADFTSFIIDNTLRLSRGSTVLSFQGLDDPESEDSEFIVKNGDVIYIPEKQNLVYVFGHVIDPGYIEYVDGESYKYYLEKAGGLGKFPRGEIYLIKGKTRSWIELEEDSNTLIEKGDFIWVPQEPYRDFDYYLTRVGNLAQIVGAITTVIVLIIQITK